MALFGKKRQGPAALVAAGSKVKLDDRTEMRRLALRRQKWQTEAWDAFDLCGELKSAINLVGNALRRVRIFAAEPPRDDPDGDPIETDDARAIEAVARLRQGRLGHGPLLYGFAVNLSVAGECYLLGREEDGRERFTVRSTEEFRAETSGRGYLLDPDEGKKDFLLPEESFFGRVWLQHPRFLDKADSPMHGVLNVVDQLLINERAVRASRRNRAILRAILALPSEAVRGPADPTQEGDERLDPAMQAILDHMTTAIQDEDSAAAAAPIILRLAGDHIDKVQLLEFDDKVEGLLEEQKGLFQRLGQGMNFPPEIIKGLGDLTHWNAWQVDDQTWKAYLEPFLLEILDGIASAFLTPTLEDDRFCLWYDASRVVVRPDRSKDADEAMGHGAISFAAYRRDKGYDDEDAPSEEELERIILIKSAGRSVVDVGEAAQGPPPEPEEAPEEEDGEPEGAQAAAIVAALNPAPTDEETEPTGAMLCLMPSAEERAALAVAGGVEPDDMHVTLFYFGAADDLDEDDRSAIRTAAHNTAGVRAALAGEVGGVAHLGTVEGSERRPCVLLPDVEGLTGLRTDLGRELNAQGVLGLASTDHGFEPHVTVGFHDDANGAHPGEVEERIGRPLSFSEVVLRLGREEEAWPLEGDEVVAAASAGRDIGPRLFEIDRALKSRLHVAADAVMSRAIERAGARIRSRANGDRAISASVKGRPAGEVAAALGPALVATLGLEERELVEDTLGELRGRFDAWTARAQAATLDLIPGLDGPGREALEAAQAEHRAAAWGWLHGALVDVATERLYDPAEPELGELDDLAVPYGILREAVARAGGETGAVVAAMAEVDGILTFGGVALGDLVLGALKSRGAEVGGSWQWVYGEFPRARGFEPHRALDGVVFESFAGDALVNVSGWPATSHFAPGDHKGCICDVSTSVVVPEGVGAPALASS